MMHQCTKERKSRATAGALGKPALHRRINTLVLSSLSHLDLRAKLFLQSVVWQMMNDPMQDS
jgi:hypothetical protein